MREVFLSHASQDHAAARLLRDVLVAHDVPVWFSPHHIRGAQQWHDEIGQALARCGWFMVLLTRHAVKSMWVQRELRYALIEKRYQDRIIPLLFRKCDVRALSLDPAAIPDDRFYQRLLAGLRGTSAGLEEASEGSRSPKI
jgi:hypothetical protein